MIYFLGLLLAISLIILPHTHVVMVATATSAIGNGGKESASPIFDRQEILDEEINDIINLSTAKEGIGSKYIDIKSVTYSSDGRFLNATIWLSLVTQKPPRDEVHYGVLADADLNNNTGNQGVDYKAEITWNGTVEKEFW